MSLRRKLLYGGAAVPWSPHALGRGLLRAWWNADDHASSLLMTDDGSGVISSWKDCINGANLTGTTTARPTWGATSFNGRAGVTADGTANALTLTGVPTTLPTGANPSEIWAVYSSTSNGASTRNLFGYGVSATGRAIRESAGFDGVNIIGDAVAIADTQFPRAGFHIAGAIFNGTTLEGRTNGRPFTTPGTALVPATSPTRVRMFSSLGTSAGSFWQGVLRHVFVVTSLTAQQRLTLEGWTAWDSGLQAILPDSHPYKGSPP